MKRKTILLGILFLILTTIVFAQGTLAIDVPSSVKIVGERGVQLSKSITIKNNETQNMTNVTLQLLNINNNIVKSINVNPEDLGNLSVGQSKSTTIKVNIKDNVDSGVYKVADLEVSWEYAMPQIPKQKYTKIIEIYVEPENHLEFYRVTATINGEDSRTLDDGENLRVEPLDEIDLKVEVRNTFRDNIRIEDVEIRIMNDDLDIDEYETISRLYDGERDYVTFSFTIPVDVDSDTYPLEITVEGFDENGARHNATMTIDLDVRKKSHDLRILSLIAQPEPVRCNDNLYVDVRIGNLGTRREDEGVLELKILGLDLTKRVNLENLYEGDTTIKSVVFEIPEISQENKEYILEAKTYYNFDTLSDTEITTVNVVCQKQVVEPPQDSSGGNQRGSGSNQDQNPVVVVPYQPSKETTPSVIIVGQEDRGTFTREFVLGLLIGVVATVIIVLIFSLLKK